MTVDCQLVHFPDVIPETPNAGGEDEESLKDSKQQQQKVLPKSVLLSEFHALFTYEDQVRGICLLNQQIVFETKFDQSTGKVKGMARDPISGQLKSSPF